MHRPNLISHKLYPTEHINGVLSQDYQVLLPEVQIHMKTYIKSNDFGKQGTFLGTKLVALYMTLGFWQSMQITVCFTVLAV